MKSSASELNFAVSFLLSCVQMLFQFCNSPFEEKIYAYAILPFFGLMQVVSSYFPLSQCIEGLKVLAESLFGMTFRSIPLAHGETWHPDVLKMSLYHPDEVRIRTNQFLFNYIKPCILLHSRNLLVYVNGIFLIRGLVEYYGMSFGECNILSRPLNGL